MALFTPLFLCRHVLLKEQLQSDAPEYVFIMHGDSIEFHSVMSFSLPISFPRLSKCIRQSNLGNVWNQPYVSHNHKGHLILEHLSVLFTPLASDAVGFILPTPFIELNNKSFDD